MPLIRTPKPFQPYEELKRKGYWLALGSALLLLAYLADAKLSLGAYSQGFLAIGAGAAVLALAGMFLYVLAKKRRAPLSYLNKVLQQCTNEELFKIADEFLFHTPNPRVADLDWLSEHLAFKRASQDAWHKALIEKSSCVAVPTAADLPERTLTGS